MVEDQGRNIAGMGIPVADKATALGGLIDRGFKYPEALLGAAK
jgi:hypothetical protein